MNKTGNELKGLDNIAILQFWLRGDINGNKTWIYDIVWLHSYNFPCEKQNTKKIQVHSQMNSGLEINLDVIPVIMTGGSLDLLVTAEFMPVIVTP